MPQATGVRGILVNALTTAIGSRTTGNALVNSSTTSESRFEGMQAIRNLYDRLGLPKEASQDDIRQAHRTLVRKYHPDTNPPKTLRPRSALRRSSRLTRSYQTPRSGASTTRGYALSLERGAPAEKAQEPLERATVGHAQGALAEELEEKLPTP
jgi:hypothetical protein